MSNVDCRSAAGGWRRGLTPAESRPQRGSRTWRSFDAPSVWLGGSGDETHPGSQVIGDRKRPNEIEDEEDGMRLIDRRSTRDASRRWSNRAGRPT